MGAKDGWMDRAKDRVGQGEGWMQERRRKRGREETKRGRKDGYKNEGMEDRRKEAIVEEWRNG